MTSTALNGNNIVVTTAVGAIYSSQYYAADNGGVNAISIPLTTPPNAYTEGILWFTKFANTNSSQTVTGKIGSLAALPVVTDQNGTLPLVGSIVAGSFGALMYSAAQNKLIVVNLGPLTSSTVRNMFVDPACRVAQGPTALALSSSYQYGQVDLVQHKATGSAVSAGTIVQATGVGLPATTGYASRVSGATITGAGIVFARRWLEAIDAASLSGPANTNTATFSCVVQHNVGSNINYTITINRANSLNNFGATTNIGTSGNISVPSGVPTIISFTVPLVAGAVNGIEMVVQAVCGAVTTKNFDFTDWQAVEGSSVPILQVIPFSDDFSKTLRYFEQSYEYGTAPGTVTAAGAEALPNSIATANLSTIFARLFRVPKVVVPTVKIYSPVTGATPKVAVVGVGDITVAVTSQCTTSFGIQNNSGGALTANQLLEWEFTADARL